VTHSLSVVIPVYNRTWELRRALQSLCEQTDQAFEVVVCDDGSTQDVRSIVEVFAPSLSLTYERIENSGGPARPRNVAIGLAQGEWISFLDSDDWWDADRVAVVKQALNGGVDMLYHPLRLVAASGRPTRGLRRVVGGPLRCEALRHMALFGNPVPNSSAVVRRSLLVAIGGICEDSDLVAYEDFDAWLRLVERGARVQFLDRVLGSYWISESGISGISERQIERQTALFMRHAPQFAPDFIEAARACHHYSLASLWRGIGGRPGLERDHLLRARALPTVALRLKRLARLAMTAFVGR